MLTSLRKSSSVPYFYFWWLHSAQYLFYFFPKCLFSVRLFKGFTYIVFALLTPGKGNKTGVHVYTHRFSFHELYNFFSI